MEADFLRLILFLAGIAVVLMVYFWERHKRVNAQLHAIRNAQPQTDKSDAETEAEKWVVTDEYQADAAPELEAPREGEPAKPPQPEDVDELSRELDQLSELVAEESRLDHAEQMPLFSTDDTEEPPPAAGSADSKVIVINIVSQRAGFNGEDILTAAADAGLEPGEMDIFHYSHEAHGSRKSTFCMASMVEPGTFPLDGMDQFVTPGLALFLQISGGQGGVAQYDEMLKLAEKLAEQLDGELQDATHSTLTRQVVEFQREEIVEFQRRQMLAKSGR